MDVHNLIPSMDNTHYYISRISDFLQENPDGLTISEISNGLSMSRNTIGKYIEMMFLSGIVDVRTVGKAKIFFLSKRIPVTTLLNYLSPAVIQTDDRYLIQNANLSAADFLETDLSHLKGRNILDLLTIQGLKQDLKVRILSPDRPPVFASELELIRSEKKRFVWLTVADVVMYDGAGGHYFVIEDVHDWKEAEESKRRYYALFHALAAETDERVFVMTPELVFTYVNPRFGQAFDRDPQSFIGESRLDICDKHAKPLIQEAARYVCSKGEPYRTLFSIQERDQVRWFDERLFPILDTKGEVREIIGFSRDITGFQEGGSAPVLLTSLMDLLHEAVITTTPAGKVLSWNRGAELMTGYPRDELIGSTALSIITPDLNAGRDVVHETCYGEEIRDLKAVIRARGGRKKRVLLSTSRLSFQDNIVSGVCIVIREH
ncbi:MAG TPA: PAS domain S-box protein [Methanospirillum sp.]|uniref:PAS domain S-box protein n=2 Tax=Methanospirillum sp. TaxID=45200 RepID=UPI002BBC65E6|nr:PAS domain S-box protein [Methanospirillum sp.]HOJ97482.1 PAS domain S-box protein [Methanospirillum sp.]